MRTVRVVDGGFYFLEKRSESSSLVREPVTGHKQYIDNERLETVDGDPPLVAIGATAPEVLRDAIGIEDDRALGLLLVLDRSEPVPAVELTKSTELCESDLNGLLSVLRLAGLVEPVSAPAGYRTTEKASELLVVDG